MRAHRSATGRQGLNLAAADVRILNRALVDYFRDRDSTLIRSLSETCPQARLERPSAFPWWFTSMMHRFSDDPFNYRLQLGGTRTTAPVRPPA